VAPLRMMPMVLSAMVVQYVDETANNASAYRVNCGPAQDFSPADSRCIMIADRRQLFAILAGALATPALAETPAMTRVTAYAFSFASLDGGLVRLGDHAGKPILVVNTASLCGYTPQYTGLQQLWTRFHDRGLMIVGVPSNDFGGQEPGGAADIIKTASHDYGVTFPLTAKVEVKGAGAHPFYKWAMIERPLDIPRWNFHKYLVGRDGHIAAVFPTATEPTDPGVIAAIEQQLSE
jgi:glutathione peroxidase